MTESNSTHRQFWLTTGMLTLLTSAVLPVTAFVYQFSRAKIEQSTQQSLLKRLIFHRMMIVQLALGRNTEGSDQEALDAILGRGSYQPILPEIDSIPIAGLVLRATPGSEMQKDEMNIVMIVPLLSLERDLRVLRDSAITQKPDRQSLHSAFADAMQGYYEQVSKY